MIPDFKKHTIVTIAQRAGFICTNPDCRTKTVGPNTDFNKSTTIGEAAHIYGARPNSKRFKIEMIDSSRAEITNAIWLCRNCHKLIDSDEKRFSSDVLFEWREIHDKYVLSELGNTTDNINYKKKQNILVNYLEYPPIIKRIIIDKPLGWEYMLTAELMRFLNAKHLRKLEDLQNNLYLKPQQHIGKEEAFNWILSRITESTNLIEPLVNLFIQLNKSWGEPDLEGDINEIHHVCLLIRDYIEQIVSHEELISFTNVPEEYQKLKLLLKDILGTQVLKIKDIPKKIDNFLTLLNDYNKDDKTTKTITDTIIVELPKNWDKEFQKELKIIERKEIKRHGGSNNSGCFLMLFFIIVFYVILF